MEKSFIEELKHLNDSIVKMGSLCEKSIATATKRLITGDENLKRKAISLQKEIDEKERYIQMLCVKLILKHPIDADLKMINTAMNLVADMEQIGEQGKDIAEISRFMQSDTEYVIAYHIAKMAKAVSSMVREAVVSFVKKDLILAQQVISKDNEVDNLFLSVKNELLELIKKDSEKEGEILESLMIAKYLERIGDFTVNIAKSVIELLN
jgi:phosphate transport system protein